MGQIAEDLGVLLSALSQEYQDAANNRGWALGGSGPQQPKVGGL
jgi:hypothetical protein